MTYVIIALSVVAVLCIAQLIYLVITVRRQDAAIADIRAESTETRLRVEAISNALPRTAREGALGYHVSMGDGIVTTGGSNDEDQGNV